MIEQNALVEILKMEVETGYLIVKKVYSEEVLFRLSSPSMGIVSGKLLLSSDGKISLKISSFDNWKTIKWDGISVYSSIRKSRVLADNVKYICSPDHFNRYVFNFIYFGVKTVCGCENTRTINDRIVAVDISYPDISRNRGCVVVRECENLDCSCWKLSNYTLSTSMLSDEQAIWLYVENWAQDNKVKIPPVEKILLEFDIGYSGKGQRYTSRKSIDRKKNKISSMKGMTLDEIKKEYYK